MDIGNNLSKYVNLWIKDTHPDVTNHVKSQYKSDILRILNGNISGISIKHQENSLCNVRSFLQWCEQNNYSMDISDKIVSLLEKKVFRENHKKFITPLQEMMINQYLDTFYYTLKERSKQTYRVNLRRYLLGGSDDSHLILDFVKWLQDNNITIVKKANRITSEERAEIISYLYRIYDLCNLYSVVDYSQCCITGVWDAGSTEVPEDIGDYEAFTFYSESEVGTTFEFTIIITENCLYNNFMQELNFQDIKDYVSGLSIVELKPISEYI